MKTLDQLKVRIFADGADKKGMLEMYRHPHIKGFTTNPTLMRKAGVANYEAFAKDILAAIPDRSISFEVFADDFDEMERQARRIVPWGKHVSVKIPITNNKTRELNCAGAQAFAGRYRSKRHCDVYRAAGTERRRCG